MCRCWAYSAVWLWECLWSFEAATAHGVCLLRCPPPPSLRVRRRPMMPYTPILATLGYVFSPDGRRVLMIHRNSRPEDLHLGKYNGLGGKLDAGEDVVAGL